MLIEGGNLILYLSKHGSFHSEPFKPSILANGHVLLVGRQ